MVLMFAAGDAALEFHGGLEDQIQLFQGEVGQGENVPAFEG
jgi:hypothetical protein